MVDFLGRDRRSNLARPSRSGQGIKSPRRPNFTLKMYPIKQSRLSIARSNPTPPKHKDVEHGVAVGWTGRIRFIAPRGFVGWHGRMRMRSMYHDVKGVDYMALKWRWMYSISLCYSCLLLFFPGMIFYEFPLTWAVGRAYFLRNLPSKKQSIWLVSIRMVR